ncbi:MAG: CorA family divalent cation transporter [Bacteroidota bacterium]
MIKRFLKILTIISTIFIPLSFFIGLYGMNFVNIPELNTESGYFILVFFMIIIACAMLLWFRKIGWIGKKRKRSL